MVKPPTKYTRSGRINIAYQEFGDGPIDIVYVPGWVSNIDLMWKDPHLKSFLSELAKNARVILFDKRGTGLSDRVTDLSTLEDRMDDIRAVMDAVGSKQAALFGHSEGGSVSALFAATYPQRTLALLTFGVFAKRRYSDDYPWAPTDEERQEVYDMIDESWGSGDMDLASLAPSMKDDAVFMSWLANYFRSGASPGAAAVLTRMNTEVDIIDILDTIEVPTLLMYRTFDIDVKIGEGRFIAARIRGSKFVEFDGVDHLFWVGDAQEVLDEILNFIAEIKPAETHQRKLSTILCTDHFSNKNSLLVKQYRGSILKSVANQHMSFFPGPSKAVHAAIEMQKLIQAQGEQMRIAIHTGECILTDDMQVTGLAVHIVQEMLTLAQIGDILVSQTVTNLLSGAGLEFINHGPAQLAGVPEKVVLLSIHDEQLLPERNTRVVDTTSPRNHSFLEDVLESIETHMSDEQFGIDTLCIEVGVSERQLQRKLKSIANKTPSQMVRSVRLHRAKEILLENDESVSQAAFQTGFNSLSYFTKCFRKEFGIAPSEIN